MTKIADLRSQTVDQLSDELLKLKKEQFNLRFQAATGQMEKDPPGLGSAQGHRSHLDASAREACGP